MNPAQFHLIINHFPILGVLFGLLLLIVALISNNRTIRFTALWTLFIATLTASPTNYSGEQAEELVEHLAGVSHDLIHEHEEKAEFALPFIIALGLLALLAIILEWRKIKIANLVSILVLGFGIFVMYLLYQVGHTGGEIRHPEIRANFKSEKHQDKEHDE
jgi:uncharacterized membrane protein